MFGFFGAHGMTIRGYISITVGKTSGKGGKKSIICLNEKAVYTLLTTNLHPLVGLHATPSCRSEGDWLKWVTQEMFSSCRYIRLPLRSVPHKYPGTNFFHAASSHNQCIPHVSLGWKLFEKRREVFLAIAMLCPGQRELRDSGCFRKGSKAIGIAWKKWCLPYVLILVSKHSKLEVNSLGLILKEFTLLRKWGDSMCCRSFYEVVLAFHSIYTASTSPTSDYLPNI